MTNQPMIRSHTGAMVPLRVDMVIRLGANGPLHTVNSLCDAELFDYECTMLHCPLLPGDKSEVRYAGSDEWMDNGNMSNFNFDCQDDGIAFYRHASPDLRTSPDYVI